jgi:flagellar biosynthesis GTPase FlhF
VAEIYFMGIIDILQPYNMKKKIEHSFKSISHPETEISSVDTLQYSERFQKFLKAHTSTEDADKIKFPDEWVAEDDDLDDSEAEARRKREKKLAKQERKKEAKLKKKLEKAERKEEKRAKKEEKEKKKEEEKLMKKEEKARKRESKIIGVGTNYTSDGGSRLGGGSYLSGGGGGSVLTVSTELVESGSSSLGLDSRNSTGLRISAENASSSLPN